MMFDELTALSAAHTLGGTRNFVANPSFEEGGELPMHWTIQAAREGTGAEMACSNACAKNGQVGLRAVCPRPVIHGGRQVDDVARCTVSDRIQVFSGEMIAAGVHVRIREPIAHTARGAILNILGYDADGQSVRGWGLGNLEEHTPAADGGWRLLERRKLIDDPAVKYVRVRLGICGVGECCFDDVSLHRRPGR